MLHLNGRSGHGEAEVFMGKVHYSHWFVLNLTGRYSLVLVQVKGTRDHSLRGRLGRLVAARRSCIWILGCTGLILKLRCSSCRRETSSASSAPSSPARRPRSQPLSLLSCDCSRHRQRVRVVLPHVFHQVRFRGIGSVAEATGEKLCVLHCVRGQVNLQTRSVCVATITVVALIRFVFVVLPTMRLEV